MAGERLLVRLLGDAQIVRPDGESISLSTALAETLTIIALSPDGVTAADLQEALRSGRAMGEINKDALQQRITSLKRMGVIIPKLSGTNRRYRLDPDQVAVDASAFTEGVGRLGPQPSWSDINELLCLWHGRPAVLWNPPADCWRPVRAARDKLVTAVEDLDEVDRTRLACWDRFERLFRGELAGSSRRPVRRSKPRLLVVEDQIIDALTAILDSEFDIVPVTTIPDWNAVCDSLDGIDGALVDRHLEPDLRDSLGTTMVADFLRRETDIPVALMSVAAPPRYSEQTVLRYKYRLVDVVHKKSQDRLNREALFEAATALVDQSPGARIARLELWVRSDLFHVESDAYSGPVASSRMNKCRTESDSLLRRLSSMPLDDADRAVRNFHRTWGPERRAARS